ncbi:hypothetical protein GOQ28_14800 [Bordetella sp. 02P26C-1]|nr:hypothetical protein [Bordetella sp. 02P26C-1]
MKTQISYTKLNGDKGMALVNGSISSDLQAKRELAYKLELLIVDEPHGELENIDARLRTFGIDPGSVKYQHISE